MQQTEQLLTTIERYLAGKATAAQRKMVNDWYHSFDDEHVTVPTEDADYERLLDARLRIRVAASTGTMMSKPEEVKTIKLWPRIAVAAAVVAAITLGTWIYMNDDVASLGKALRNDVAQNDIAPGKNGATITLENGKVMQLSGAKSGVVIGGDDLKYNDGTDVSSSPNVKSSHIMQMTATTAKGQTYQFTLPDGTKVWLNANSKLEFPSSFVKSKTRFVKLFGEGYFEVAKDKIHPFVVKTEANAGRAQEVEVLGTHFNINAYADEPAIATTLLEGSVKLTTGSSDKILKPGEQAISDNGKIKVGKANIDAIVDWKKEEFFLDKMDFRVAMRKIARWYNIEVIYNGSVPANLEAGGWIPRNSKLSNVLKSIESTGQVKFKIEGKKLYVSK
jgi:ferric-dicitrate binding protein FerR (iron transport regulator)